MTIVPLKANKAQDRFGRTFQKENIPSPSEWLWIMFSIAHLVQTSKPLSLRLCQSRFETQTDKMKALTGNAILAQNRFSEYLWPPGLSCFYKLLDSFAQHPLAFCPSLLFHREVWLLMLPWERQRVQICWASSEMVPLQHHQHLALQPQALLSLCDDFSLGCSNLPAIKQCLMKIRAENKARWNLLC